MYVYVDYDKDMTKPTLTNKLISVYPECICLLYFKAEFTKKIILGLGLVCKIKPGV